MLSCGRFAVGLAVALVLAGLAGTGCVQTAGARLWADTASPDATPSTQSRQWAYDGETVTFELEVPIGAAHYVIFGAGGEDTVVTTPRSPGRYRWTHVFHCGAKPQVYEVYATPFLIRGKIDWVFDSNEQKWIYYPTGNERADVATAPERVMTVTCYRVEVRIPFKERGGPPRQVSLSLLGADGRKVEVPRARPAEAPATEAAGATKVAKGAPTPGYLILRQPNGDSQVQYTPRFDEVGRAGKTLAELLIVHADGSAERLTQELDTP
jgi:hypothetical protein